jgi:hypothetical protein
MTHIATDFDRLTDAAAVLKRRGHDDVAERVLGVAEELVNEPDKKALAREAKRKAQIAAARRGEAPPKANSAKAKGEGARA